MMLERNTCIFAQKFFMSQILSKGFKIKTKLGRTITIKSYIAGGGQGDVYVIDYNGSDKALKWYKPNGMGKKPKAFYDNIENNVMRGAPSTEFLWPIDVTEWVNGVFGYVMELRPKGFYELNHFMLKHVSFKNYKTMIDAALHIVSAFRILHNLGYSYQDLNDGNFFINPENGKVLICDNDNVAPNGTETGILGKPRYMAPEIVMEKKKPDNLTDRFSMSIILFILFCFNHPLEGKKSLTACLTPELQKKLYGEEAVFMMDPNDKSNAPNRVVHGNTLLVWPCLPEHIREIFTQAFSKQSLTNGNHRPKEIDWIKALVRFRSEIVACPSCHNKGKYNDIFTSQGRSCKCDCCGTELFIPYRLEFSEYSVPALYDSRIYRCQLGPCNADEALTPVARIAFNDPDKPNVLSIKNLTDYSWNATTPSGKERYVRPKECIPLIDGIKFSIKNAEIVIRKN